MKSISCNKLQGIIETSPSKSHFIRLLVISWLYQVELEIINPCLADDCLSLINILKNLNCKIYFKNNKIVFKPSSITAEKITINCGESATILRFFAAITSLLHIQAEFNGNGTLLKRDFTDITENLKKLNAKIITNSSKLPITIENGINTNKIILDASKSSQFLSGILIALAKSEYSEVSVNKLVSKNYIDLTLQSLSQFGIELNNLNYEKFILKKINLPKKLTVTCENDWSGASFWMVAAAINGEIQIEGLNLHSKQGDKIILDILKKCGANLIITENKIIVKASNLKAFEFDATNYPDLVPALIPLALNCNGKSIIYGPERLINKESNRLDAIIQEFSKMGGKITLRENKLFIQKSQLSNCELNSHNDHRIAMSLIISTTSNNQIKINNIDCINKSYPAFLSDFKKLGGKIYE